LTFGRILSDRGVSWLDQKYLVVGAQPTEVLKKLVEQIRDHSDAA